MRYPLVDGQGNFGSIDGDPPAAYRYTEARLESLAEAMMADLDKDTVDFRPNFDETTEEPVVLPTPFPNLLVNGSTGIAVGMATSIPPHNMREVIDGVIAVIEQRDGAARGAVPRAAAGVPGPDFPSGGTIVGREGIYRAYREGRGGVVVRGKTTFEEQQEGRPRLDRHHRDPVSGQQEATLVEEIAELVRDKKHRGHLGSARRVEPRRHADRHRAQARRAAGRRAEQSLQAHEAADELRHHAAGDRRRAGRACSACSRSSSTSSNSGARSSGGGSSSSCARPKRARTSSRGCGSRSTTSTRSSRSSAARRNPVEARTGLDHAVRPHDDPGAGDPRHAAPAAHGPRAAEDPRRARRAREDDRAAARRSCRATSCSSASSSTS